MYIPKSLYFFLAALFSGSVSFAQLTQPVAERLAALPLDCIHQEFPNKTSHTADGPEDAKLLPSQLHPVFYGCLDWHSSVHGHWMLVRLLQRFPDLAQRDAMQTLLNNAFQKEKMEEEAAYFTRYSVSRHFERTYGWAWLLRLDQELLEWDHPDARRWHQALQPLTRQIVSLWKEYLPKATYPNRTGVHPNSAFGLGFALDWARATGDEQFEAALIRSARTYYLDNRQMPAYLEPDGSDFFSPSLMAADLMARILSSEEFGSWMLEYYDRKSLDRLCTAPVVSDRDDYQIVHLDGLSFSRAWCMKGIAAHLQEGHAFKAIFETTADRFIREALPAIFESNYGGGHWLASFAVYAMGR